MIGLDWHDWMARSSFGYGIDSKYVAARSFSLHKTELAVFSPPIVHSHTRASPIDLGSKHSSRKRRTPTSPSAWHNIPPTAAQPSHKDL